MPDAENVRNEFLLHLKSNNIIEADQLFVKLIGRKEFRATLISRKPFHSENKVAYRIKIAAAALILFKKKFDEMGGSKSLQLFEFKEW